MHPETGERRAYKFVSKVFGSDNNASDCVNEYDAIITKPIEFAELLESSYDINAKQASSEGAMISRRQEAIRQRKIAIAIARAEAIAKARAAVAAKADTNNN